MKKMSIALCLISIMALFALISAAPYPAPRTLILPQDSPLFDLPYNPSHLMVRFHPLASSADQDRVISEVGGWVEWDYDQIGWKLVRYDMGISFDEMKRYVESRDLYNMQRLLDIAMRTAQIKSDQLRANSLVDRVEFDYYLRVFETDFTPNDPYFIDVDPVAGVTTPQQYSSFDVQLPQAWDVTQGSTNVRVAIIDSGTDTDHPDMAANIARWPAGGVRGWDFVGGKDGELLEIFMPVQQDPNPDVHWNDGIDDGWGIPDPSAGDGQDLLGMPSANADQGVFHGTWTASCASGATNNSLGVAGAGFNVKIMPVRCISPEGGVPEYLFASESVITMGVNWAAANGAHIISMSLGAAGLELPGLHDAIINAYNNGIAVFAASGNSGNNEYTYPAAYDEVFAAGSFTQNHHRATFSTYGPWMDCLAGGGQYDGNVSTVELIWGGYVYSVADMNGGGPEAGSHGYVGGVGTSAACPQAAGIGALVLSIAPDLLPSTLYNVLRQTCLDVETPGWDELSGWGIIQSRSALNLINATYNLSVTLTPQGSTIIPPGGGNLTFQVQLRNNGSTSAFVDFWTEATLPPGGNTPPLFLRPGLTLAPGSTLTRTLTQAIPGSAPAGNYVMHGYAGFCQGVIKAQGQFNFSKSGLDNPGQIGDWSCTGWDEEPSTLSDFSAAAPDRFELRQNSPNPFNPITAISYQLSADSHVSLRIYNTAGRLVTELVNGRREAGVHEETFDGSNLASGVYLYRLHAGDFAAVQKLILLK
jgi:subtilisin family serine protease